MLSPLLAAILAGHVGAPAQVAAASPFPPARSLVPYVAEKEVDCYWTMHDPKEKWIRGGIGPGDGEQVFDLVDSVFYDWDGSADHAIEVSVGDPARRVKVIAWASNAGGQTPGSIGFRMSPDIRKLIGGATSVQIWKGGKPVYNTVLAGTPSAAKLEACVRPPES